ncbi:hypothetical protein E4T56_gene1106 [Termitomyces sp. T112]|nr:hypothetical protein E4T56_gene1106 [Termitomyces sp. T112]
MPVGRKILKASSESNLKVVTLELAVVFDDADLEQAEGIYDDFLSTFTAIAKNLAATTGDPFVIGMQHGPQISQVPFDVSSCFPTLFANIFVLTPCVILPSQEKSITNSGIGPVTFLSTPQSPSHERTISTLNNAIQIMTVSSSAVSLPVVKGVLASVAGILNIIKTTIANKDDFQELVEQCQMIGLVVWRATSATPQHQLDGTIHRAPTNLTSSVDGILEAVKAKTEKNVVSKVFDRNTINKWKNELIRFLTLFNTEVNISTNLKVDELLDVTEEPDILPTRPRVFVGRSDLVQSATDALLKFHHVALIGPGGIGKSSVARAVLNDEDIVSKFQAKRYFVRFDDMDVTQVNLKTFLDHIMRALGFATPVNAYNLITKTLSTSETLLVLDNAETFLDATIDSGWIADAIDGFGAQSIGAILLTTCTTVLPPNMKWVRLRVPPLEESAACEAFHAYYPSIETSILIKLLSAVDFHPLSINLLAQAAVQNEWSPQDLITAWDHQHATLIEAGNGKTW